MALLQANNSKQHVKLEDLTKKQLNLYPLKNGKMNKKQMRIRMASIGALALVGIVVGSTAYTMNENSKMEADIIRMKANLQVEKERLDNQRILQDLTKRIMYKSQLLSYIDKSNTSSVMAMETIEDQLPEDVKYVNLSFVSDSDIEITCSTSNLDWVAKLVHQLKAQKVFTAVFVESIQQNYGKADDNRPTEYEFVLICTFGGKTDAAKK